jgi:hypothetical protein
VCYWGEGGEGGEGEGGERESGRDMKRMCVLGKGCHVTILIRQLTTGHLSLTSLF